MLPEPAEEPAPKPRKHLSAASTTKIPHVKRRKPPKTAWTSATRPISPGHQPKRPQLYPRGTIKGVIEYIANDCPQVVGRAFRKGLNSPPPRSFPYLQLAAYYLDGKPVERIQVQTESRMLFVGSAPSFGVPGALPEPALLPAAGQDEPETSE